MKVKQEMKRDKYFEGKDIKIIIKPIQMSQLKILVTQQDVKTNYRPSNAFAHLTIWRKFICNDPRGHIKFDML